METIRQRLKERQELLTLTLMLEFLHFAIWTDFGGLLSKSLILVHLGLFLLWQPVWRSDEQISWLNTLTFSILTLTFVIFLDWRLMFLWLVLMIGFIGGRIAINRQERMVYIVVMFFLLLELIIVCTPSLFKILVSPNIRELFSIFLPVMPLVLVFIPPIQNRHVIRSVDILHALSASTLTGVLVFGSLLNMYLGGTIYLVSILETLTAIALFLFIISWLLSPRTGFSGLSQLWSNSLLNLGTPFEMWLGDLSNHSVQRQSPEAFLEAALENLIELPWITGVKWDTGKTSGALGDTSKHETQFTTDTLNLSVYTDNWMGGALYLHCKLLIQLVDNFYTAKVRERKLTTQAHLQAVHETGARVTHDIKNLLQSFQAITSIIMDEQDKHHSRSVSQQLLERQLPHLTQRLQLALDKLQTPDKIILDEVPVSDWWADLKKRVDMVNVNFEESLSGNNTVPVELFDSAIENMLENLREKSRIEPGISIRIALNSNKHGVNLDVSDTGSRIDDDIVLDLFYEPVRSNSGLGIGLYQVAQLAKSCGYKFELASNENGSVRFSLTRKTAAGQSNKDLNNAM